MAESFSQLRDAGRALSDLHVGFEALEPYPLQVIGTPGAESYEVREKMRLDPERGTIAINESLTFAGIPKAPIAISWETDPLSNGSSASSS